MAYDEEAARRIRSIIKDHPFIQEKKMFGGIGFLLQGNMACGVHGLDLIVRVGQENFEESLTRPHARPFDMTGRPMSGWVMVSPQGYETERELEWWVKRGIEFAKTLPPK